MRVTRNNEPGAHRRLEAPGGRGGSKRKNTRMQHPYTWRKNNIILFWPPPPSLPPPLARSLILSRILLTRAHVSAYLYTHIYIYTIRYVHTYNFFRDRTRGPVCVCEYICMCTRKYSVICVSTYIWDVCACVCVSVWVCEAALEETTDRSLVNSRFLPPSFAPFCTHARQAINRPDRIYAYIVL